ncbi:MAG TPA: DUF445 family protein [Mesorhizobium sp.]|jgi:uncharacterized membrane-anchored protein YjiN (DUF445 family)|nr:DUF445 family protein [Mesorhizobium sp.]
MRKLDTLSPTDLEKLRALRRVKAIATAALALCLVVFLLAKAYEDQFPWLGFVAAFAEAAAIGGLADWYAVVALFRHPLGVPIPHTAIIPENQNRIAENLGRFIETNFLAPEPVREKLRQVDFAQLVADWLADPSRSAGLSRFVMKLVPQMLAAVERSGLRDFVSSRMLNELGKIDVAPLAADLLGSFTEDRRHQQLFDEMVKVLGRFLRDEQALGTVREKIRDELPALFRTFRADAYLLNKIVNSATTLLDEVRAQPNHPLRGEFDRFAENFIEKLRHSPDYARRAEQLKADFLGRPELRDIAQSMWTSLTAFIEEDARSRRSTLREQLAGIFVNVGKHLAEDRRVRADMNAGFVVALSAFVESQKSGVSTFIGDQVKGWDLGQLTRLIELNVGRDLQFIRFNGMAIGGIAGLVLYILELATVAN